MSQKKAGENMSGFMVYFSEYKLVLKCLDDNSLGALFRALFDYAYTGEESELKDGKLQPYYEFLTEKIDTGRENYIKTSEARSRNARKRWEKEKASQVVP